MLVVITGPPSSGKTTQCDLLLDYLKNVQHITCEKIDLDKLLKVKQDQYPIIKQLRQQGKLKTKLPSHITREIMKDHLRQSNVDVMLFYRGPSTLEEAHVLPNPDIVIILDMSDRESMIQRAFMRRVDLQTGKTYNLVKDHDEIEKLGIRDRLTRRLGDDRELFTQRLERHEQRMHSIFAYYETTTKVVHIDGQRDYLHVFNDVKDTVLDLLSTRLPPEDR